MPSSRPVAATARHADPDHHFRSLYEVALFTCDGVDVVPRHVHDRLPDVTLRDGFTTPVRWQHARGDDGHQESDHRRHQRHSHGAEDAVTGGVVVSQIAPSGIACRGLLHGCDIRQGHARFTGVRSLSPIAKTQPWAGWKATPARFPADYSRLRLFTLISLFKCYPSSLSSF